MSDRILSLKYTSTGNYHIEKGIECQDHVATFEDDDIFIAVLCDGIGSLENDSLSAEITCQSVITCLYNYSLSFPVETIAESVVDYAQTRLFEEAEKAGISPDSMGCTVAFAAIRKKKEEAVIGCLGDSAVCVLGNSGSRTYTGYSAGNVTCSIMDQDAATSMVMDKLSLEDGKVSGVILCSDGLENEIYVKGSTAVLKPAEDYFNRFDSEEDGLKFMEERISLLKQENGRGYDDDISIILVRLQDGELCLPDEPNWLCSCGNRNPLQQTYCGKCGKDFSIVYKGIRFRDYDDKRSYFLAENRENK